MSNFFETNNNIPRRRIEDLERNTAIPTNRGGAVHRVSAGILSSIGRITTIFLGAAVGGRLGAALATNIFNQPIFSQLNETFNPEESSSEEVIKVMLSIRRVTISGISIGIALGAVVLHNNRGNIIAGARWALRKLHVL